MPVVLFGLKQKMPAHTPPIEVCAGNVALSYLLQSGFLSPVAIGSICLLAKIRNSFELLVISYELFFVLRYLAASPYLWFVKEKEGGLSAPLRCLGYW